MLKRHPKKKIVLAAVLVAALYFFWPGFSVQKAVPRYAEILVEEFGIQETATLNVIGVEPHLETTDFASAVHLEIKLSSYLEVARENDLLRPDTLVLFPAHIGTGLLAAGQKSRTYNAGSISNALTPIISYNLAQFSKNYYIFDAVNKRAAAAIRAQSQTAAMTLDTVFSALARKYKVTIVAGSGLLMTPGIYPGGLTYGHGPIFHTSFVYTPDGKPLVDAVRQIEPSAAELTVAEPSLAEFLPIFTAGDTNYGIAIGADADRDDVEDHYMAEGVTLLLSPQFYQRDDLVEYPFGPTPRYKWGMAVSMKGEGWGLSAQGRTALIVDGEPISVQNDDMVGRIYNLWVSPKR